MFRQPDRRHQRGVNFGRRLPPRGGQLSTPIHTQFKLSISGNNKPRLNNVDDAARRRINMVPFENKPAKPDDTLKERLKTEHAAILRWMIDGCLEWQKDGLQPPKSVQAATDEYFDAQDHFGRWLDECCVVHRTLETKPSTALKSFQEWCGKNGEEIVDSRRFYGLVEKTHGLSCKKTGGVRLVRGLGLNPPKAPWNEVCKEQTDAGSV